MDNVLFSNLYICFPCLVLLYVSESLSPLNVGYIWSNMWGTVILLIVKWRNGYGKHFDFDRSR